MRLTKNPDTYKLFFIYCNLKVQWTLSRTTKKHKTTRPFNRLVYHLPYFSTKVVFVNKILLF